MFLYKLENRIFRYTVGSADLKKLKVIQIGCVFEYKAQKIKEGKFAGEFYFLVLLTSEFLF
jgi:hypothetical protein